MTETNVVVVIPQEIELLSKNVSVEKRAEVQSVLNYIFNGVAEMRTQLDNVNVKDENDKVNMLLADTLRKGVKTLRLESEKQFDAKRAEVQSQMISYKTEDALWLKAKQTMQILTKEIEEVAQIKADTAKRAEQERIQLLGIERENEMRKYTEIIPAGLGLMDIDTFAYYFNAAKLSYDAKVEAERVAEEQRITKELADMEAARVAAEIAAKEKADAIAKQIELQAEIDKQKLEAEAKERELETDKKLALELLEKQKAISEARELALETERKAASELLAKQQAENEAKIEVELKKAAELARIENEKANALLMEEQAKQVAYEQQVARDAKIMSDAIAAEKAKTAKLEADAKLLADAEIAKQLKAKQDAELAAKAPRKEKLTSWANTLAIPTPAGMESDAVVVDIMSKFNGFQAWAKNEINKI